MTPRSGLLTVADGGVEFPGDAAGVGQGPFSGYGEDQADICGRTNSSLRNGILALDSPKVRAVRGRGLMIGVEFKTRVTPILKGLQDRGVLALPAGSLIIRFRPPLVITDAQIDQVVAALGETLA